MTIQTMIIVYSVIIPIGLILIGYWYWIYKKRKDLIKYIEIHPFPQGFKVRYLNLQPLPSIEYAGIELTSNDEIYGVFSNVKVEKVVSIKEFKRRTYGMNKFSLLNFGKSTAKSEYGLSYTKTTIDKIALCKKKIMLFDKTETTTFYYSNINQFEMLNKRKLRIGFKHQTTFHTIKFPSYKYMVDFAETLTTLQRKFPVVFKKEGRENE